MSEFTVYLPQRQMTVFVLISDGMCTASPINYFSAGEPEVDFNEIGVYSLPYNESSREPSDVKELLVECLHRHLLRVYNTEYTVEIIPFDWLMPAARQAIRDTYGLSDYTEDDFYDQEYEVWGGDCIKWTDDSGEQRMIHY